MIEVANSNAFTGRTSSAADPALIIEGGGCDTPPETNSHVQMPYGWLVVVESHRGNNLFLYRTIGYDVFGGFCTFVCQPSRWHHLPPG